MTTIPFDAIGFDLDGTLLDTFRDLGEAVNHALVAGGFTPVSLESSKGLIGGGAKLMLSQAVDRQLGDGGGMPKDDFRALYKTMLAFYADNNAVHSRPYPGVIDTLDRLAEQGVTMAVVTNKFEAFAKDILTKLDLAERFVAIIGGDTMGKGNAKPAPDPLIEARRLCADAGGGGRFAFVGDSTYDVAAAKAAGVPVIAAAYGYCDRPPYELGADAVIEAFADLIPALAKLESR
ncbi:MAG: HAD hydrolase-like protein [Pontixanthobacter sp.]